MSFSIRADGPTIIIQASEPPEAFIRLSIENATCLLNSNELLSRMIQTATNTRDWQFQVRAKIKTLEAEIAELRKQL